MTDVRTFFATFDSNLTLLPTTSQRDLSSEALSVSVRVAANRNILARGSVCGLSAAAPRLKSPSARARFEARWTSRASAGLWDLRRLTRIKVVADILLTMVKSFQKFEYALLMMFGWFPVTKSIYLSSMRSNKTKRKLSASNRTASNEQF